MTILKKKEGFGNFAFVKSEAAQAADQRKGYRQTDHDSSGNVTVARRVMFKPMLGLFKQETLLPLRYCFNNGFSKMVEGFSNVAAWGFNDIQCKCDLLTLDNSLDNGYASHLLSGKSLPINFDTWNHTNQSTGNDKIRISAHITRAVTRLKNIFITPHKPDGIAYKEANYFYHPASANGQMNIANEHSYQVQTGSKLIPEYPVSNVTESYSQLKKTVGRAFKIHSSWYRSHKYIIGFDLEKISGAGIPGLSTKPFDLLTLNFKDCDGNGVADSVPTRMLCALNYDCVLSVDDSSTQLLD